MHFLGFGVVSCHARLAGVGQVCGVLIEASPHLAFSLLGVGAELLTGAGVRGAASAAANAVLAVTQRQRDASVVLMGEGASEDDQRKKLMRATNADPEGSKCRSRPR